MAGNDSAADTVGGVFAHDGPSRPPFQSGLPEYVEVSRPVRVRWIAVFVVISTLAFAVSAVVIGREWSTIRADLIAQLAEEADDYTPAQISKAVTTALSVVVAVRVSLVLGQLMALRYIFKRRRGGRTSLVVLTIFSLPAIAVVYILLDSARTTNVVLFAIQALAMVVASVLAVTRAITRWLHVRDEVSKDIFANESATDGAQDDGRTEPSADQPSADQPRTDRPSTAEGIDLNQGPVR